MWNWALTRMASKAYPEIDASPCEALPDALSPVEMAGIGPKVPLSIVDYISGKAVRATPEEVEAVQVFARRLVDELGYPKTHIQTRPQFRVRATPSAEKSKSYPVDISVFSSARRLESYAQIIIECKKRHEKTAKNSLRYI